MRAVEDVSVPAATGDGGDLAAVEADSHLVGYLWLRRGGWLGYCAAEVKSYKDIRRSEGKEM